MSPTGHTAKFLRNAKLGRNRRTHALTCPRPDPLVNDPDRTQLHIGGVLSYVEGWAIPSQPWGDIAMKASLLFVAGLAIAISSIAPANAAPVRATGFARVVAQQASGQATPRGSDAPRLVAGIFRRCRAETYSTSS